jgi:hypothetical protein
MLNKLFGCQVAFHFITSPATGHDVILYIPASRVLSVQTLINIVWVMSESPNILRRGAAIMAILFGED